MSCRCAVLGNNRTFYTELMGLSGCRLSVFKWVKIIFGDSSLENIKKCFLYETDHGFLLSLFLCSGNTHSQTHSPSELAQLGLCFLKATAPTQLMGFWGSAMPWEHPRGRETCLRQLPWEGGWITRALGLTPPSPVTQVIVGSLWPLVTVPYHDQQEY